MDVTIEVVRFTPRSLGTGELGGTVDANGVRERESVRRRVRACTRLLAVACVLVTAGVLAPLAAGCSTAPTPEAVSRERSARPAQGDLRTPVVVPAIHADHPEALGMYWVELRSLSALELDSLVDPRIYPSEEQRLSQPYRAPQVSYASGVHENPVTTAQMGLADYTRFRATGDSRFLKHSLAAGDWLLANQSEDGAWRVGFGFEGMPPGWASALCQGQGISLLARLYAETSEERYLEAARKAYAFMLRPVSAGGTMDAYADGCPVLEEYPEATQTPHVLNGAILAAWGVRDLALATDDEAAFEVWDDLAAALEEHLEDYDNGGWSTYASTAGSRLPPADVPYHRLHIAQCRVMYALTGRAAWRRFGDRWEADLQDWAAVNYFSEATFATRK